MANRVTYNNFSSGVISPEMRRMVNSEIYGSSASVMENVYPSSTGGFRLRDGLVKCGSEDSSLRRIIPFCISETEMYLILIFSDGRIFMYSYDGRITKKHVATYTTYFNTDEKIERIQYAQTYDRIVLVQNENPPYVIMRLENNGVISFSAGPIKLNDKQVYDEDTTNIFNYDGLFTEKDFPSLVSFVSGRLWFANSKEHPFRMWASRPFEYDNFQDVQYYKTVEDTATAEEILASITGNGKEVKYGTGANVTDSDITLTGQTDTEEETSLYRLETETSLSTSGYQVIVKSLYQKKTEGSGSYWNFVKSITQAQSIGTSSTIVKWNEAVTADCAMVIEVGSDRNDSIQWIQSSNDIYAGTSSSEYMMDRRINAQDAACSKIASFGACSYIQPACGNNNIIYVQSDGKTLRTVKYGYYGPEYSELNRQCMHLFRSGIRRLCWQRVPYPRLYALLNDGTCAVMCGDLSSQSNAWSHISTEGGAIIDITVADYEGDGQIVFILVKPEDAADNKVYLMSFIEGLAADNYLYDYDDTFDVNDPHINTAEKIFAINAVIVSNSLNSIGTLSTYKGAMQYYVDSLGTPFMIAQEGVRKSGVISFEDCTPADDSEITKVNVYGRNTYDLRFRIQNMIGSPFRILAIESVVEVV